MTIKNPYLKIFLQALAIAGFGFILLTFTFLFDFIFQSLIDLIIRPFAPVDFNMTWNWVAPFKHWLFVLVIGLISWWVFRTKLNTLYKAIFITVPTAVVLATIGLTFFHWPVIVYTVGGLLTLGVLYYFYKTKQPWFYYFAVVSVAVLLMIMTVTGVEI